MPPCDVTKDTDHWRLPNACDCSSKPCSQLNTLYILEVSLPQLCLCSGEIWQSLAWTFLLLPFTFFCPHLPSSHLISAFFPLHPLRRSAPKSRDKQNQSACMYEREREGGRWRGRERDQIWLDGGGGEAGGDEDSLLSHLMHQTWERSNERSSGWARSAGRKEALWANSSQHPIPTSHSVRLHLVFVFSSLCGHQLPRYFSQYRVC